MRSAGGADLNFWLYLMIIASLAALLTRRLRAPYALVLVMTGLLLGMTHLLPAQARLEPRLLFTVFLPPLLFESAINLRARALLRNALPILVFAFGATIASTFIVGWLAANLLGIPLKSALVFGALISATDPISVIAVFRKLGADRRLTLLIDAEALFNDGVAVVLFSVLLSSAVGGSVSPLAGAGLFLLNVGGGIGVGAFVGYLASRTTSHLDDHLPEIMLTTLAAYGAYIGAEALHVSGVVAVVASGLVVGNYGLISSMTASSRMAVQSFWEVAAFACNSLVFLLVGIEEGGTDHLARSAPAALGAALIVLAGRASLYPLAWIVNAIQSRARNSSGTASAAVSGRFQHVLFWGGLRGALSIALALGLPADLPARSVIVTATYGAVLFSLLIQGLTVGPLLRRLGLAAQSSANTADAASEALTAERIAARAALDEIAREDPGGRATDPDADEMPAWAVEPLIREYRARLDALEDAAPVGETPGSTLDWPRAARRRVLMAERDALREAAHTGHLREETVQPLIARIDAHLLGLRDEEAAGGA